MNKINILPIHKIISDKFELICQHNRELKLELSANGELLIMSPTGGETGSQNAKLIYFFVRWNEEKKQGIVFDSSTCFKLPFSQRSPDVAWILKERWESLTTEERKRFPPIVPDFVLELMSPTDSLKDTQEKMQEYMEAGVRLGWLINPQNKTVEIYRQGKEKEILSNPYTLLGEDILHGLVIDLRMIFD